MGQQRTYPASHPVPGGTVPVTTEHLRATLLERQGRQCLTCPEPWADLAHVEPSGMGGRNNRTPDNLVGLCRTCHQIFDGHQLQGRQRMMRDLMLVAKQQREQSWGIAASAATT